MKTCKICGKKTDMPFHTCPTRKTPTCPNGHTQGFNCIGDAIVDCVVCGARPVFVNPNERPTPLTDAARTAAFGHLRDKVECRPFNEKGEKDSNRFFVHRCDAATAVKNLGDKMADLERKLARVTEDEQIAKAFHKVAVQQRDRNQVELDDALAKLAKCRETLQTLSQWALPPSHEITRIARETLEQTK